SLTRLQQPLGRHAEVSALGMVQQPAEQRLAIEPGDAQPRDAAVPADQRSGRPVSDQPEVLQRKVTGEPPDRTESRVEFEHVVTPPAYAPPPETLRPVMRIFTALGHMRLLRWVTPPDRTLRIPSGRRCVGRQVRAPPCALQPNNIWRAGDRPLIRARDKGVPSACRGCTCHTKPPTWPRRWLGWTSCMRLGRGLAEGTHEQWLRQEIEAAQRPRLRTGRARACDRA